MEPQIKRLTPLFLGEQLDLATCIRTEFLKVKGGHVFVNHHSSFFFFSRTPLKQLVSYLPIGFDDDIDEKIDKDEPQPQDRDTGGGKKGGGDLRIEGVANSPRLSLSR